MSDPSDRTDCWCAKGGPCEYHEGAIDMAKFMQARITELEAALLLFPPGSDKVIEQTYAEFENRIAELEAELEEIRSDALDRETLDKPNE